MEAALISLLNTGIKTGLIAETTLIFLVIGILLLCYKYMWKPTKDTVDELPSLESIKELLDGYSETDRMTLDNLTNYLKKIDEKLQDIGEKTTGSEREIQDMKKDVDSIREILNQIQGHLLYSHSSGFGNRELK